MFIDRAILIASHSRLPLSPSFGADHVPRRTGALISEAKYVPLVTDCNEKFQIAICRQPWPCRFRPGGPEVLRWDDVGVGCRDPEKSLSDTTVA